ncbi:MAG: NAD kinase [Noviherbaspirillum sp.]
MSSLILPLRPVSFRTIAIVGKPMALGIADSLAELAGFLESSDRTVVIESETAKSIAPGRHAVMTPDEIGEHADAAIVVGGDGTMLGIARQLARYDVPLIGINQGRLGFITDIPADRMLSLLSDMLNGNVESEQRSLLEGRVLRGEETIFQALAFNDVVVSRGAGAGMIELRVEVDGHFMYNQRSDGLIVSTPTGSTAYALSAGGPLLHPRLGGFGLVPIAPHALSNRPIVVPDSSEIMIELINGRDSSVNFDMQSLASLANHDRILIRRSEHAITFLHPQGWNYYDTLREKLHWNEYPSAEGRLK